MCAKCYFLVNHKLFHLITIPTSTIDSGITYYNLKIFNNTFLIIRQGY